MTSAMVRSCSLEPPWARGPPTHATMATSWLETTRGCANPAGGGLEGSQCAGVRVKGIYSLAEGLSELNLNWLSNEALEPIAIKGSDLAGR